MNSTLDNKHAKRFWALALMAVALFYVLFIYRTSFMVGPERYFTLRDDAMISMRYAKHLASGYGLVWNVGEAPVQGFTNLGWTLYMAALHLLPIPASKIALPVMISSALLLLGTAWLVYRMTIMLAPESGYAAETAFVITALYYPLVYWSLRGMEVGLATFLVCALAALALEGRLGEIRRSLLAGLLVFLALLVRMDLIVPVGAIMGYIAYRYVYRQKTAAIQLAPIWTLFLAGAAGVPLFQRAYFGSALPNTYYLKVTGVSLAERINTGLQTLVEFASRDFLALLLIVLLGLWIFKDLRRRDVVFFLGMFVIQCAYSVYVGGDYAESLLGGWVVDGANRFITQGMPFLIVLFSVVIERVVSQLGWTPATYRRAADAAAAIALAALMVMSGDPWFEWSIYNAPGLGIDITKAKIGLHIREYTREDAVIAVHAAGQIPYFSGRTTVDLLGKSDPVIARGGPVEGIPFFPGHNKWDYAYSILELQPDLIADEWGFVAEFLEQQPDYARLDNGIWIWEPSERLELDGLAQDYQ